MHPFDPFITSIYTFIKRQQRLLILVHTTVVSQIKGDYLLVLFMGVNANNTVS